MNTSENEKRTKRRAPRGAYAITKARSGQQYITTVPAHIAGPLYEADLALTWEVAGDRIILRPIPMTTDPEPCDDEATRALVQRIVRGDA